MIEKLKEQDQELPVVVYGCEVCIHGVSEVIWADNTLPLTDETVRYVALELKDDWP